jgi:phenylalanyl-tRNA synthetase alpha chain
VSTTYLSAEAIRRTLTLRDLSDPAQGPHAMQLLVDGIEEALSRAWGVSVRRTASHPVVSVEENYDRLLIPADAVARDARYTRYLNAGVILRTHTTAMIPGLLEQLAAAPEPEPDLVLACAGLVYRRDAIDRRHVGEPHQLDLWRVRTASPPLAAGDLEEMIALVVRAALPGREWRTCPTQHPYTVGGLEIEVREGPGWVEVGECGTASPLLLAGCGLHVPPATGLAMGLGLDRLLMLRKGIGDIRLLRSADPRVTRQMLDLDRYTPVSCMPPVKRDISIALPAEATLEDLGDEIRSTLGPQAEAVEHVELLSETPYADLAEAARARLGIARGQKNVLVRIVLASLDRTLTDREANELRDRVCAALHRGTQPV